ncbi:MAG TPA: hypothetical protein VMV46_20685 [Thermoanaerobaculia bacterium]|nr:hypothetical protein [Thermoanaerobaculia bacterium]
MTRLLARPSASSAFPPSPEAARAPSGSTRRRPSAGRGGGRPLQKTVRALAGAPILSPDLVRELGADLLAVLALALLVALWLLIQRAWRRVLPEHAAADEAHDVRWGNCGAGCGCAGGACRRERASDPHPIAPRTATPAVPPSPEPRR